MSNIILELKDNVSANSLAQLKAINIANAYAANFIAALVIILSEDRNGLRLLNDKNHVNLKSFSENMSRPNYWGFIVFNSDNKSITKHISAEAAKELSNNAGRVIPERVKKLQRMTISRVNTIDWEDAAYSVKLLKVRFNLSFSKINNIANGIYSWSSLDEMAKGDVLYSAFTYLMQSDNDSNLLPVLRRLVNNKYLTVSSVASTLAQKVNKVFRISEDEGGGDSGGEMSAPDGSDSEGTDSKDIQSVPVRFEKGKIIKRIKRNWKVRKWKDPFLNKRLGDYSNVKIN